MRQPIAISAAIGGLLSTGVALAAVLWPDRLAPEVQASIIGFGNAVILTFSAIWAAMRSTPTSDPMLTVGTSVNQGSAVVASINPPPEPTADIDT